MESSTQMTTFKNELASLFTSKLESFINELCAKHGMTPENIMNDWKDFSAKKETIDTKKNCECPNMTDLKEKCRMYKLKVGGKKNELVERIRAYEAGELVCDSLSIKDLKEKLRAKNLKVSGTKDELIKRLSESGSESGSESESESVGNKSKTNIKTPYNKMKLMELRIELKTRGLKSSGKKDELIKRLMDDNKECESLSYGREEKNEDSEVETEDEEDDYVKMSEAELKVELKGRALSRKGTKEQMIKRLMDDDNFGSDSECESECESSDSECESECGDS